MQRLMLLVVLLLILLPTAFSATVYWTGGGVDSNWNTAGNWNSSSVPANGDDVVLNGSSSKNCIVNVNTANLNSLTIDTGYLGGLTLTGGNTIYLGSGASAGTMTIRGILNFSGNTGANVAAITSVTSAYMANISLYGIVDWDSGGSGSNVTLNDVIFNLYNNTETGGSGVYVRSRGEFHAKDGGVRQFIPTANDKLIFTGNTTLYSDGTTYLYLPTYGWIDYENNAVITTQGYYVLIYTAGNKRFYQVEWNATAGGIGLYSNPTQYFTRGITIYPGKKLWIRSSVNYFGTSSSAGYLKIYGELNMDRDIYSSTEPQLYAESPSYPMEMYIYGIVRWNCDSFGNRTHLRNVILILKNNTATDGNGVTLFMTNVTIRADLNDSASANVDRIFTITSGDAVTMAGNVTLMSNGSASYLGNLWINAYGVLNYSARQTLYLQGYNASRQGIIILRGTVTAYDVESLNGSSAGPNNIGWAVVTNINVVNSLRVQSGSYLSFSYYFTLTLGNSTAAGTIINNGTLRMQKYTYDSEARRVTGSSPLYPAVWYEYSPTDWDYGGANSKVLLQNLIYAMKTDMITTGGSGVTINASNVTFRADLNDSGGGSLNRQFYINTGDTLTLTGDVTLLANGSAGLSATAILTAENGVINYTGTPTLYMRHGDSSRYGGVFLYGSATLYNVNVSCISNSPAGYIAQIGWYSGSAVVNIQNTLSVDNASSLRFGSNLVLSLGNSTASGTFLNNGTTSFAYNTGGNVVNVQAASPSYPALVKTYTDPDWDYGGAGSNVTLTNVILAMKTNSVTGGAGVTIRARNLTLRSDLYDNQNASVLRSFSVSGDKLVQVDNVTFLSNGSATLPARLDLYGSITYEGTPTAYFKGGTCSQRGPALVYYGVFSFYDIVIDEHSCANADAVTMGYGYAADVVNITHSITVNTNARVYHGGGGGTQRVLINIGSGTGAGTYTSNGIVQIGSTARIGGTSGNYKAVLQGNDWDWDYSGANITVELGYADVRFNMTNDDGRPLIFNFTGDSLLNNVTIGSIGTLNITNCSITATGVTIKAGGCGWFENVTENIGAITVAGQLFRFANYPLQVVNGSGTPIASASINITDNYSGTFQSSTTNAAGFWYPRLFKSYVNSSGTLTVLDNLSASYGGQWNSILINSSRGNNTITLGASQGYSVIGGAISGGFTPNMTVDGTPFAGPYTGTHTVELRNASQLVATFPHNFSTGDLDLNTITARLGQYWVGFAGRGATLYVPLNGSFCNVRTCSGITNTTESCAAGWNTADSEVQGRYCILTINGTVAEEQADPVVTKLTAAPIYWEWVVVLFGMAAVVVLYGSKLDNAVHKRSFSQNRRKRI